LRTEFGSNIPLLLAHANAPIRTEPLMEVYTNGTLSQSENSLAFCSGTITGITTMFSVAKE